MTTQEVKDRKNLLAVNFSLAANVVLAFLKTGVGILGHSPALLAEGINSTSDVVYLAIVRVFMGAAGRPPDREHPFGHRQLESIAALVIGAFVVTTGIAVFWTTISQVYELLAGRSEYRGAEAEALWVALVTLALKVGLTFFTGRVGRQTGSVAVLALTRDHRNDIVSISAVVLGIFFGRAGYAWFDPAAGALVALVIVYTGVRILRDSSADLMDVLPREPIRQRIRQLLEEVPGVEDVEEIHVHRIGHYLMIDVTVGIDGSLSVTEGDAIATAAEDALRREIEFIRHVSVHYHPSHRCRLRQSE